MNQRRAYKYRCYPTTEQRTQLNRTFGCVRFVYNWGLHQSNEAYAKMGKRLAYGELSKRLADLKRQPSTAWLREVSSVPLQQSLRHLERGFVNFFKGFAHRPTFHKKRGAQAATYVSSAFRWDGEHLTLAKMKEPLPIRWSRDKKDPTGRRGWYRFTTQPTSVTVSLDAAGRYFVSFSVDEDIEPSAPLTTEVGIDLGLHDVVALSTGEKVGNPHFFSKDEKRLAKAQRRLSRKKKGSKNRAKARLQVARIHAHIADKRNDFLHKLTTRLVDENQVLALESLQVKNMQRNHRLAKSIADVGWGELVRQVQYKAAWQGRTLVQIDRFFPSSKRCSDCGFVRATLPLSVREWTCPQCGTIHDRDINAAQNVLAEGRSVLACGGKVSPMRQVTVASRVGTARRSRKPSA